ncbi:hypothetical protein BCR42DRAFT_416941 [Absidia repens]|uniref:C2H2-type domain-containing protein n=1 Tax=Absidia repens TaxID=90262 RepID=A0A1X2IGT5_9FUNG|nr:hypothetical protein BCR42DRAFT_416941 [Absidia repens]
MPTSPSIDQIISQSCIMNSTTPLDLHTLFEGFDDTSYHHYIQPYSTTSTSAKALHGKTTDDMVNSLLFSPSASSLSLPSSSTQQNYQPSPMINTPCLDAFTPTITGVMGDSPTLATPFMDPTGGSHFMGASGMDLDCIQNYFTPQLATAPDTNFSSVDPSDLELGQVHDPQTNLALEQPTSSSSSGVAATVDDSLFPPLTHEEQQFTYGVPSSGNDLDLLFDDLFGSNDFFPSNETGIVEQQQPLTTTTDNNNNKRKRTEADDVSSNSDQISNMVKHAKLNDARQFVCTVCQRGFSRRYNLGTHFKTHNKNRSKPFECHLCDKSFDRKHDCERHVSTVHLGERLFTCKPCNVSFSRRDALSRHQTQKHTN